MKKFISVILILMLAFELTGCEAIQRKFVRKKKRKPIKPRFYQEGVAETRPHLDLYILHYTYWKTWQEDLMVNAGANSKRDAMACNEIMGNLMDMKKHLKEEKAKELNVYITEMGKITREIKVGGSTAMRLGFLKQKADKIRGRVIRNFYYKKIREHIKPD